MIRIYKLVCTGIISSIVALFVILLAPYGAVMAQPEDVCRGARLSGVSVDCQDGQLEPSDSQFSDLVRTVISVMSIVVGAISVIMLIIGGFRYIISGGDSNGVTGAKNTIMYAIIGLVVVLFAQIIVRFVFTKTDQPNQDESWRQQQDRVASILLLSNL